MKSGVLLFFALAWFSITQVNGQAVRHSYRFYENFQVAAPECGPDLTASQALGNCAATTTAGGYIDDALPCGVQRKVYHTNVNWGLMYPNATGAITDNYTIQMYIKVTDWGKTWARIIDFSNGLSDQGVYFKDKNGSTDRCIDFYPYGIAGACPYFNTSSYYLLTFTRNGQTGIMDVYVDNTLFVSYDDKGGRYVGKAGTPIYIFRDDSSVPCESGAANFAYLSFSDQYSSQGDVSNAYSQICSIANINATADFSIEPNPNCSPSQNINVKYTGDIPEPGTGYTFGWDWEGATIVSGTGMGPYVIKYDTPGTKNITLTVSIANCPIQNPAVNKKQAVVGNLDLTTLIEKGTCNDNEATLTLNGVNGTSPYQFSIDSTNYQTSPVFKLLPNTYRVYVKDVNKCVYSKLVKIDPSENILLQTINDTIICNGQQVQLLTNSNASGFSWEPSTGLDDILLKDPVATPISTTQYIVTATKDNCTVRDTVVVIVIPEITITTTPDTQIEPGVPFQLTASSPQADGRPGTNYAWLPPNGLDHANIQNPYATILSNTTYTVRVTSAEGCFATAQVNLTVSSSPSIYVPTAFSPDGDGKNETLQLITTRITTLNYFRIYNRWGQVVFYTNQMDQGWNGRFDGAEPVNGTYVFQVEGVNDQGEIIRKQGSVLLLR